MTLTEELARAEWLIPWQPLEPAAARERESALTRAVSPGHPLHALVEHAPIAIAARIDDVSDTLFLLGPEARLCVLPLAQLSKLREQAELGIFSNFAEFREACMWPDHLEYTDEDV
jgi:hypothetical protein